MERETETESESLLLLFLRAGQDPKELRTFDLALMRATQRAVLDAAKPHVRAPCPGVGVGRAHTHTDGPFLPCPPPAGPRLAPTHHSPLTNLHARMVFGGHVVPESPTPRHLRGLLALWLPIMAFQHTRTCRYAGLGRVLARRTLCLLSTTTAG